MKTNRPNVGFLACAMLGLLLVGLLAPFVWAMQSSGTTALATSGDSAVTVTGIGTGTFQELDFITTGSAAGFFSLDGGTTWCYFPAGASGGSVVLRGAVQVTGAVKIQRISGGSDMTGVYVFGH